MIKKLTFTSHIDKIINKATGLIAKLYPPVKSHSALEIKNRLIICKMLIRPVLTYATAIWVGTCESNILKLQKIQTEC